MKRKAWIWIILGVVVTGLLVAAGAANVARSKVTPVQLARVRREDVTSHVKAPGKIEPKTQVKISADIMGKIDHLYIKEGDPVQRGELMMHLNDVQYRSLWDQAKAGAAAAHEHLRQTAENLKVAESNYARQKSLSNADWEQAESAREAAIADDASAHQQAAQADALLRGAADNLEKTRFVAPFDGVVSALNVEQGEIVVPGTMDLAGTQVMTVSDLSRMQVRADVDETDIVEMKFGQKAKITVDALPDTFFMGTVTEIGNTAKRSITSTVEGQTNFEVVVVFDQRVPQVRPGMTADVEIQTGTHSHVLVVPIQSVVVRTQRDLDRANRLKARKVTARVASTADEDTVGKKDPELTGVFVVNAGSTRFVPVRPGLSSETMIEVQGDLKEGDEIVSGPYKALRELKPGGKVRKDTGAGAKK